MPELNDDLDLDLEDTDEDLDLDSDKDADTGDESKDEPKVEDKRIRDLQSKADKAEARANKAEAALQKAMSRGEGKAPGNDDPERAAFMSELREASLDAIYAEHSQLADYGIDRSLIEGTTRAQLRESAASLVSLIKSVETKARNRVMKEYGVKAEPAGAQRGAPVDYDRMGDEDFEKVLARVKSGGDPIW